MFLLFMKKSMDGLKALVSPLPQSSSHQNLLLTTSGALPFPQENTLVWEPPLTTTTETLFSIIKLVPSYYLCCWNPRVRVGYMDP